MAIALTSFLVIGGVVYSQGDVVPTLIVRAIGKYQAVDVNHTFITALYDANKANEYIAQTMTTLTGALVASKDPGATDAEGNKISGDLAVEKLIPKAALYYMYAHKKLGELGNYDPNLPENVQSKLKNLGIDPSNVTVELRARCENVQLLLEATSKGLTTDAKGKPITFERIGIEANNLNAIVLTVLNFG
ncbi:hypothetical protein [Rhizobium ruizarguesonis]|uniref:hypothetical protein n=1 Tax=Rhizobium ruizarguesonis TaxID=2081791 RepID=UPI001030276D|nr:hypothetical protein [Rhizobium ruizarguesonis]TBD81040.1 hypothetical protein ELH11_14620 [Rhizobium ruizarguesonis]TBE12201.1 hypothetical protein ELH09_14700 [Rhizobium ruizarguesonis]WSH32160.1 hypothetical protein U8P70_16545 [Rhizobium ruizarguesonis]